MSGVYAGLSNEQLQQHINAIWNKLNTFKPSSGSSGDLGQIQADLEAAETEISNLLGLINNLQVQITADVNALVLTNQQLNTYIFAVNDLTLTTIPALQANVNQALFDANAASVAANTAQSDVNALENTVASRVTLLQKHRHFHVPATSKNDTTYIIADATTGDVLVRNRFADVVTIGTLDGLAYYDGMAYPAPNTHTIDFSPNSYSFKLDLAFWVKYTFLDSPTRDVTLAGGSRPNELMLAMRLLTFFPDPYTYASTLANAGTVVPFNVDSPVVNYAETDSFYQYHHISHTSFGTAGLPVHFRLLSRSNTVPIAAFYLLPISISISLANYSLRPVLIA